MEQNWFKIKCLDSICSLAPNSIFASSFLFQNFLFFPNFQFPKTWFFDWHLYQIRILKIIFFLLFLSFLNQMHLFEDFMNFQNSKWIRVFEFARHEPVPCMVRVLQTQNSRCLDRLPCSDFWTVRCSDCAICPPEVIKQRTFIFECLELFTIFLTLK